jgi:hypothetical protein
VLLGSCCVVPSCRAVALQLLSGLGAAATQALRGTLPLFTPATAASTAWSLEAEEGEMRHAMELDRWTQSRW